MALVVKDRVKETSSTTGTGTLTLGGALAGFQTFTSVLSDGDTTYYTIFESSTGEFEVGLGTFTASGTTLARTTILESSNSGNAINLTAGSAEVFISQPAEKSVTFDANGDVNLTRDPQSALQAATKQYVDTLVSASLHYHDPVRVQTTGNLSATYSNGSSGVGATLTNSGSQAALSIDGVTLSSADRVLVSEQTNAAHNGVYTVTTVGTASTNWVLTRATDADSYGPSDPDALGQGDAFFIKEGSTNAGHLDVMNTSGTITFGTTNIVFAEVAETTVYSAGNGLTLTGTTFAAGAGTGVTVNANDIAIGQAVGTSDSVTFSSVTADLTGDVTGNADTATALETARTIGGVSFNGTANINLPGVNTAGNQDTTGNAATATALATGRTISLTGDVTGTSGSFDGSGNVSIAATIAANSVALGTDTTGNYVTDITAGTLIDVSGGGSETATVTVNVDLSELTTSTSDGDGDFFVVVDSANAQKKLTKANINISGFNNDAGYTTNVGDITGVTAGSFLTGGGTSGTVTVNVDATSANTASKVVSRDSSGNFSAGTITATLSGNASTATTATNATNATNADTVDSLHASSFIRSDADDSASGDITFTESIQVQSGAGSGNPIRIGNGFGTGGTGTIHKYGAALYLQYNNGLSSTDVYMGGGGTTANLRMQSGYIDNISSAYVQDYIYHQGDTDTYLGFGTNTITLATGGSSEVTVDATGVRLGDTGNGYFQPVSGNFGSIQIDGGAHTGYEGYSIGGRVVFMHDNSSTSYLYNDVDNEAFIKMTNNAGVNLYYNGSINFSTTSTGIDVVGTAVTDGVTVDGTLDIEEVYEKVTTDSSTTGTLTFDTSAQGVYYLTANQTANRTINFSSVNGNLNTGQSLTCAVLCTQGSTPYYLNAYQVDGSSVTPKWQGGSAPSAGNASGIDSYSFTIIKTADATFTVLASITQYA